MFIREIVALCFLTNPWCALWLLLCYRKIQLRVFAAHNSLMRMTVGPEQV